MVVKKANITKVGFKADIKRKQSFFNRFKKRFHSSCNPTEKRFLKTEAKRVCTELKMWSKKWQNWGFGSCTWITKNYNVTSFTSGKKPTGARKSSTSKSYGHKSGYGCKTSARSPKVRRVNRTRSSAARRSYSAW